MAACRIGGVENAQQKDLTLVTCRQDQHAMQCNMVMAACRVCDVENDQALNERISPLYHADKIKAPLLIGQGANDPRVKQAEADQIYNAMKVRS